MTLRKGPLRDLLIVTTLVGLLVWYAWYLTRMYTACQQAGGTILRDQFYQPVCAEVVPV
jgi:hypothetical protein